MLSLKIPPFTDTLHTFKNNIYIPTCTNSCFQGSHKGSEKYQILKTVDRCIRTCLECLSKQQQCSYDEPDKGCSSCVVRGVKCVSFKPVYSLFDMASDQVFKT